MPPDSICCPPRLFIQIYVFYATGLIQLNDPYTTDAPTWLSHHELAEPAGGSLTIDTQRIKRQGFDQKVGLLGASGIRIKFGSTTEPTVSP